MANAWMLKTWLVKTFFKIPSLYILTGQVEERLFHYIISQQRNAFMVVQPYVTVKFVIFVPMSHHCVDIVLAIPDTISFELYAESDPTGTG